MWHYQGEGDSVILATRSALKYVHITYHNLHVGAPEYSTMVELENEQEQSEDSSRGLRRGRGYTTQSLSW